MAKKLLTGLTLVNLPSDPSVGSEGELYFNTSASVAKIYKSGSWSEIGSGGGTTVSETEPPSPLLGDSWYQNTTNSFFIYDGTFWLEVNTVVTGPAGPTGPAGADSVVAGPKYNVVLSSNYEYLEIQKILASDYADNIDSGPWSMGPNGGGLGSSIAISADGNTAIVGARFDDASPNENNGAAYIFTRSGSTWTEQQKILASDRMNYENFGSSVAISADGNTVLIGKDQSAAAYIFTRSGSTWVEQQKILASDGGDFGQSVAISADGNTVLIGSRTQDTFPTEDNGAAYIFTRSGSTWVEQQKILTSDIESNDQLGFSVAISADGNTVLIGTRNESTSPNSFNGAAYIFTRSGNTWVEQQKILASDRQDFDDFGFSVAISADGNTVLIGAVSEDTSPNANNGAAYIFTRSGSAWTEQQKILSSDAQDFDDFGSSVVISADGNTVIVGASSEGTSPNFSNGAAYIFTRSGSTWTEQQKILASDRMNGDNFGSSVAISADGNTVLIGAVSEDTSPNANNGAVYAFDARVVGASGVSGAVGSSGPQGDIGPIGPTGPAGADSVVAGPQGVQGEIGSGSGGAGIIVSTTAPEDPAVGTGWYQNTTNSFYVYDGTFWVEVNTVISGGSGAGTIVSTTAPEDPEVGTGWYNNETGVLAIYDGTYWVEVNGVIENPPISQEEVQDYISPLFEHSNHENISATYDDINNEIILSASGTGTGITISETAPEDPQEGDGWYNNGSGSFYLYDGTYWVEVNGVVSLTQEQIQDDIVPLFIHENHENISVTYDDINNQVVLSASGGVVSISGTAPIVSTGTTTPVISIDAATTSVAGSMSSADKVKLDALVAGSGVAAGGTTGQALVKVDGTNYNTEWTTPASGMDTFLLMGA